jgi:subtilisin family serine protease
MKSIFSFFVILCLFITSYDSAFAGFEQDQYVKSPTCPFRIITTNNQRILSVDHNKVIGASELNPEDKDSNKIKVIIIDSCMDANHPDYSSNLTKKSVEKNFGGDAFQSLHYQNPLPHGTAVTSLITGKKGISPNIPIRFIDYCIETLCTKTLDNNKVVPDVVSSIAEAIRHAANKDGKIINLSLKLSLKNEAPIQDVVKHALKNVVKSGKIIVMAAGNDGIELGINPYTKDLIALVDSPEIMGRAVLVGALSYKEGQERLASFSNRPGGKTFHYITAPGDWIYVAQHEGKNMLAQGTSYAAPQVTAALQLLMNKYPGYKPEEYVNHLLNTARTKSFTDDHTFSFEECGAGVLNIKALLEKKPQSFK